MHSVKLPARKKETKLVSCMYLEAMVVDLWGKYMAYKSELEICFWSLFFRYGLLVALELSPLIDAKFINFIFDAFDIQT